VIGVARNSPDSFPGTFIQTDLADQDRTQALAKDLAARNNVFGIVNNVGLAKHERIDGVEFGAFTAAMDLNVRPALQLTQALLPRMRLRDSAASSTSLAWLLVGLPFVRATRQQKQPWKA